MSKLFGEVQSTVKEETIKLAIAVGIMAVLMEVCFAVLHQVPQVNVPFDYTVVLGGIGGSMVAVFNFFLMGLTIQGALEDIDEDTVKTKVKASYRNRMMMQAVWIIIAILVPFVQAMAGMIPLLFPGIWFKICALTENKRNR